MLDSFADPYEIGTIIQPNRTRSLRAFGSQSLPMDSIGDQSPFFQPFQQVNREGFTGMLGENAVTRKNERENEALKKREAVFLRAKSEFAEAEKQLHKAVADYERATNSGKRGQGATLGDKQGYINNRGFYQPYLNRVPQLGDCPSEMTSQLPGAMVAPGSLIGTGPAIMGNSVGDRSSCAPAGSLVQVTSTQDVEKAKANWVGCRTNIAASKMNLQSDLTGMGLEACKTRAADRGAGGFGLMYSSGGNQCYVPSDQTPITDPNEIGYKTEFTPSTLTIQSANPGSANLLVAGPAIKLSASDSALSYGEVPSQCDNYDAVIMLTGATWGGNCNGQVKIN